MILRVRRGLEANRTLFTPSLGEPIFTTDTKRLYVGDGVTPGGIPVDIGGGGEGGEGVDIIHRADKDNPHEVTKAQVGLGNVPNTDFTSAVAANTAKRSYPTADQNKLADIEAGATANSSDADLRDRLTHTGTQPISSVTGLQSALDSKQVAGDYATSSDVTTSLNNKVDKVTGKQLSTEDYTTTEKTKLANATTGTALSVDNTLPRFDGTDGKTLQNSGVFVSDDDDIGTTGFIESTFIIGSPSVAVDEIVEYYEDEGVLVDGVLVKDGLVSGRDVALDGYKLDSVETGAEVNAVTSVNGQTGDVLVTGEGGTTDHGLLDGLGDDDHTQYHNDTRGDARYYTKTQVDTQLDDKSPMSHNHDSTYAALSHTHTAANVTDFDTEVSNNTDVAANTSHRSNTSNPHSVTATQVGLGNVDNTSDATKNSAIATLTNKTLSTGSTIDANVTVTAVLAKVYPVGSIYTATVATNPATLFGFGTWAAYGEGRVIVGKAASGTFGTAGATGGAETVTLTAAQSGVPAHSHGITDPGHSHTIEGSLAANGGSTRRQLSDAASSNTTSRTSTTGISVNNNSAEDAASAHNNLQPYIVAYIWERTA